MPLGILISYMNFFNTLPVLLQIVQLSVWFSSLLQGHISSCWTVISFRQPKIDSSKVISTVVYTSEPRIPFCSGSGFSDFVVSFFFSVFVLLPASLNIVPKLNIDLCFFSRFSNISLYASDTFANLAVASLSSLCKSGWNCLDFSLYAFFTCSSVAFLVIPNIS